MKCLLRSTNDEREHTTIFNKAWIALRAHYNVAPTATPQCGSPDNPQRGPNRLGRVQVPYTTTVPGTTRSALFVNDRVSVSSTYPEAVDRRWTGVPSR